MVGPLRAGYVRLRAGDVAAGVGTRCAPEGRPAAGLAQWRMRYASTQVSEDIREIFCETCDLVALRWTRARKDTVYVSRMADVAVLDGFIGPEQ